MQVRTVLFEELKLPVVKRTKTGPSTDAEVLEELAPSKPASLARYRDLINFVKDRPGHDARYAVDAAKIQAQLGWVPEETFETGLRKTVQWYLDNKLWWERVMSGAYRLERVGVGR